MLRAIIIALVVAFPAGQLIAQYRLPGGLPGGVVVPVPPPAPPLSPGPGGSPPIPAPPAVVLPPPLVVVPPPPGPPPPAAYENAADQVLQELGQCLADGVVLMVDCLRDSHSSVMIRRLEACIGSETIPLQSDDVRACLSAGRW